MNLTFADANSPLWRKIKDYLIAERLNLRIKNDSLRNSEQDTTVYRAHIALLTRLIDLDKQAVNEEQVPQ